MKYKMLNIKKLKIFLTIQVMFNIFLITYMVASAIKIYTI